MATPRKPGGDVRCGAKCNKGGTCKRRPLVGADRCKRHGGGQQAWSRRHKHMTAAGQAALQASLDDPGLLDVRRPIAVAQAAIEGTPVLPSDGEVERLARLRIARNAGHELLSALRESDPAEMREALVAFLEPTPEDLDGARAELADRTMRLVSMWSKRQIEAVRYLDWSKVITEMAIPLFTELGAVVGAILRRHVPEAQAQAAIEEVQRAALAVVGQLAAARDQK